MRLVPLSIVTLGAALCASCAQLPELDFEVCGNGVLEPQLGEQCDLHEEFEGTRCAGPEDAVRACRYVCTRNDPTGPQCPPGWQCATDGVCQFASGRFEEAEGSPIDVENVYDLALSDIDGDGRADISIGTFQGLGTLFARATGDFSAVDVIATELRTPWLAAGDLDRDGRGDLVAATPAGPMVALGQRNRRLEPTQHAVIPIDRIASGAEISFLRLFPARLDCAAQEPAFPPILAMAVGDAGLSFSYATGNGPALTLGAADGFSGPDAIPGNILVFEGDRQTGPDLLARRADEIALALPGTREIRVYRQGNNPQVDPFACDQRGTLNLLGRIPLELGLRVAEPRLRDAGSPSTGFERDIPATLASADVDGDDAPDFLVAVQSSIGARGVAAALSSSGFRVARLDERFASLGVDLLQGADLGEAPLPFAAGDLDGDGTTELVGPLGVYRIAPSGEFQRISVLGEPRYWRAAVIADLNRDGLQDVLAAPTVTYDGLDLVLLAGAEGSTTTLAFRVGTIGLDGAPSDLARGDFDGDGVDDVGLRLGVGDFFGVTEPAIIFGERDFAIEAESVGAPGFVAQTVVADVNFDGKSDLSVVGADPADPTRLTVTLLFGSQGRRLASPFIVGAGDGGATRALVGRFGDSGSDRLDILAFSQATAWLIEQDDSGIFAEPQRIDLSSVFGERLSWLPECGLLTTLDLDGDRGTDEILHVPWSSCGGAGDGKLGVAFEPSFTALGGTRSPELATLPFDSALQSVLSMQPAALDASDAPEVIVSYAGTDPDTMEAETGAAIFWDLRADFAGGALTLRGGEPERLVIPASGEEGAFQIVTGAVALQADQDPAPELAVLALRVEVGEAVAAIYLARRQEGGSFALDPTPILEETVRPIPLPRLSVADLDGDGLDDLLLLDRDGARIFRSVPARVTEVQP
ncbi:MAG: VCBS repeat-containing protein [Deltaproteobacteria bacterium]|nr:VCBS repeat-containing protein [Deltaproteobacteria bacterium]